MSQRRTTGKYYKRRKGHIAQLSVQRTLCHMPPRLISKTENQKIIYKIYKQNLGSLLFTLNALSNVVPLLPSPHSPYKGMKYLRAYIGKYISLNYFKLMGFFFKYTQMLKKKNSAVVCSIPGKKLQIFKWFSQFQKILFILRVNLTHLIEECTRLKKCMHVLCDKAVQSIDRHITIVLRPIHFFHLYS